MNKRHGVFKGMALFMAAALWFGMAAQAQAPAGTEETEKAQAPATPEKTEKAQASADPEEAEFDSREEVLYALAGNDGAVENIYSVNIIDVTSEGLLTDYGRFDSVKNLTNTNAITCDDGTVRVQAVPGRFFYQGNMIAKELPWDIVIKYTLDGKAVEAKALAGASGHLKIHIQTFKNKNITAPFYDNYMLQVTVTLDGGRCVNIVAKGATPANAGSDKLQNFTVLPGKNGDMIVEADVTDFEMTGISISAVPFSMELEMGDISQMTDGLDALASAIRQLSLGAAQLNDGAARLKSGAASLQSGAKDFGGGLYKLSNNSANLSGGSQQILDALQTMNQVLASADMDGFDISALAALPEGLTELAGGLDGLSDGIGSLTEGLNQAIAAMDGAVAAIPAASVGEADIGALMAANPDNAALGALITTYQAAQTVKGTYAAVAPAFYAVRDHLPELAQNAAAISEALKGIRAQLGASLENAGTTGTSLEDALNALKDGIAKLAQNYGSFHNGLVSYTDGVRSLAGGYGQLTGGIDSMAGGLASLSGGAGQLSDGLASLDDNAGRIPDEIETYINEQKAEYDTSDFKPVSFVSPQNKKVTSVQFVIQTAGIQKTVVKPPKPEPAEENVWTRLKDLFTGA